jgi:hypothetical protein
VRDPTRHPVHTPLVDPEGVGVVVGATKCLVVDDGEKRKAHVGKKEEVAERAPERERHALVSQVIEIHNQAKHEHGTQDWPHSLGPRRWEPIRASQDEQRSKRQQERHPNPERDRQVADCDQYEADADEPGALARPEHQANGAHGEHGEAR